MFPYWLVVIQLLLLLGITTYRTLRKGFTQYKNETKQKQKLIEENEKKIEENIDQFSTIENENVIVEEIEGIELNIINGREENENQEEDAKVDEEVETKVEEVNNDQENQQQEEEESNLKINSNLNDELNSNSIEILEKLSSNSNEDLFENDDFFQPPEPKNEKILNRILKFEGFRFPFYKAIPLILSWLIILISSLLKGGHGVTIVNAIKKCSFIYWTIVSSVFPSLIFISFCVAIYLRFYYLKKLKLGFKFAEGDVKYTLKNTFLIPAVCLFAGIVAGKNKFKR